ncbi:hypothetical protein [Novosphingobium resinovorum]|uniref:Uncharacterized protein n=1 Tax=Novosphingobium resinovorum TaxID=158500 RepID=A0A1D8A7W4_9SPHN|nr:hypothetical protein [Novosphingobium resinovorum]AOR78199.1 hypothetical protein BES08_16630 [Novosphingobium resinovorum]
MSGATTEGELYFGVGNLLGGLSAIIIFLGGWFYCASVYGFLFGFGLGWIASGISAAIAFFAVKYLWGLLAVGALVLAYLVFFSGPKANDVVRQEAIAEHSLPQPTSTSDWSDWDQDQGQRGTPKPRSLEKYPSDDDASRAAIVAAQEAESAVNDAVRFASDAAAREASNEEYSTAETREITPD